MKLPLQPIYKDGTGHLRFRENKVVDYLLANGGLDLNQLAQALATDDVKEDWEQFAQLIGYSLSGFSELSYVSDETNRMAEAIAEGRIKTEQEARIEYLEDCLKATREALKTLVPQLFKIHPDDLKI